MEKNFDLSRFIDAQDGIYSDVIQELREGKKSSHWMWFIFPQIQGLGLSSTSQYYSIKSKLEAIAFYDHPILGQRLIQSIEILLELNNKSAEDIFGYPDYLKLKSSITLFANISSNPIFTKALHLYFKGHMDERTLDILNKLEAKN